MIDIHIRELYDILILNKHIKKQNKYILLAKIKII